MPRAPMLPQVGQDPGQVVQYGAPNVAPVQDQSGRQLQQLGQALGQAGQDWQQLGAQIQQREDVAMATERDTLNAEMMAKNRSDYGAKLGKSAVDGFEDFVRAEKKRRDKLLSEAKTPGQRSILQRASAQRLEATIEWATSHRDRQMKEWQTGATSASAQQSIDDAVKYFGLPERDSHFRTAVAQTEKLADLQGASPEQRALLVKQTKQQVHLGTLDALLAANKASEASAYLASPGIRSEIAPQELARAERTVKVAGVADKAQRTAMLLDDGRDVMAKVTDADQMFAKGELSVEERDAVVERLKIADNGRYQQQNRVANKALADATDFARANRIQSVDQLPAKIRTDLEDAGELDKVRLFLDQGGQFTTTRLGLRVLNSVTPGQLLKVKNYDDLESMFQTELSTDDMAELAARWRKTHALAAEPGDEEKIDRGLILRNAAREAGLILPNRDPTDEEKARMDRYIEAAMRETNSRFGGKAGNEQFRQVARDVAFDSLTVGSYKVPYAAATKDELQSGFYTVEGRKVFNRNVSETTKNQYLEAIDIYNAEAAKQGVPLKPRTMAQVFTEWEKSNVKDRAELTKSKESVKAEVFKDVDVLRAYHKVWRGTIFGGRDAAKTYDLLQRWQNERMRYNGEVMTNAEWFMRSEGLTAGQYAELLRVAQSETRTREER